MKLVANGTALESNAEYNRGEFKIGDMAIILELLTKLYSKPIQTLTQEYISNARDAMREASNTSDKIEITLPTRFEPTLKIRDFGVGLSKKRIQNVFLYYGNSTKRDTNGQNGGFGIGAKSAWSYTDSFTVTSWCDNNKSTYICHKTIDNGNMDEIGSESTLEKTGVEIQIAVNPRDVKQFVESVYRAMFFWNNEEKPTILNPEDGYSLDYKYEEVTPNFKVMLSCDLPRYIHDNYYHYDDTVFFVIDGIPYKYKTDSNIFDSKIKGIPVLFIDNGVLQIAPNREELVKNDYTNNQAKILIESAEKVFSGYVAKKMNKCKDMTETIALVSEMSDHFDVNGVYGDYTFKGNGIFHDEFKVATNQWGSEALLEYKSFGRGNRIQTGKQIYINSSYYNDNTIYYIDIEESKVKQNERIRTLLTAGKKIVILPYNLKHLAGDLSAIALSSVERLKKAKTDTKKDTTKMCLHTYDYQRSNTTWKTLAELDKVFFVWAAKDGIIGDQTAVNAFLRRSNVKVYTVSKSVEKKLKAAKIGMHVDRFISKFKPNNNRLGKEVNDIKNRQFLEIMIGNTQDTNITNMFKYLTIKESYQYGRSSLPEVLEKKRKPSKELAEFKQDLANYDKALHNKYTLVHNINFPYDSTDMFKNDIIEYVNNKNKRTTK